MLADASNIAQIITFFVGGLSMLYAFWRHRVVQRRIERPEGDRLSALKARVAAVEKARLRFRARSQYQIHQTHVLLGGGVIMIGVGLALSVLATATLRPLDFSHLAGYLNSTIAFAGIMSLTFALARHFERSILVASDYSRIDALRAHIAVAEAHPLEG